MHKLIEVNKGINLTEEKENLEWLDKKLNILRMNEHKGLLNRLIGKHDLINEFGMWTPLKLVCLSYFVGPYVRIINSLKSSKKNLKIYYFDIFAGTGINKIKDRETYFAGSPILTIDCATSTMQYFDEMYFSDLDEEKIFALSNRLEELEQNKDYSWIQGRYYTIIGDANIALQKYAKMLKNNMPAQFLAFIDPYRSEVKLTNLRKLLAFEYGDLIYTLQAKSIARIVGKAIKQDQLTEEKIKELEDFLGCPKSSWKEKGLDTRENVKNYYMKQIRLYRRYVLDIQIKGKNFDYFMIYATRKFSPNWKPILENLKKEIEKRTSRHVKYSIDFLEDKQGRLSDYY